MRLIWEWSAHGQESGDLQDVHMDMFRPRYHMVDYADLPFEMLSEIWATPRR